MRILFSFLYQYKLFCLDVWLQHWFTLSQANLCFLQFVNITLPCLFLEQLLSVAHMRVQLYGGPTCMFVNRWSPLTWSISGSEERNPVTPLPSLHAHSISWPSWAPHQRLVSWANHTAIQLLHCFHPTTPTTSASYLHPCWAPEACGCLIPGWNPSAWHNTWYIVDVQ